MLVSCVGTAASPALVACTLGPPVILGAAGRTFAGAFSHTELGLASILHIAAFALLCMCFKKPIHRDGVCSIPGSGQGQLWRTGVPSLASLGRSVGSFSALFCTAEAVVSWSPD